jgi:hypothetical protein
VRDHTEILTISKESSKINSDQNWHEPAYVEAALEQSLAKLQLEYGRNYPIPTALSLQHLTSKSISSGPFLDAL